MSNAPLYEGLEYNLTLSFSHLYGDKWAAFYGKETPYQRRRIIFPQFTPEEGKEYAVRVKVTKTGIFTYKGEDFQVCRAELAEAATKGEVLVHQMFNGREPMTEIGLAMQRAGVGSAVSTALADQLRAAGFRQSRK